ncbi:biogenesis protein MshI [Marinobacter fuscus]|uniref:Biogenesis protein MshI n=1 Tax=Marinobacter fuscus TaxID=2109942 RepID=A0A2T1K5W5_9GAMM|nr:biogenesis protein MshI [Marinobacter fuscus]PSF05554.1 biogenesis protein MshI [Marinobacter fuscus]
MTSAARVDAGFEACSPAKREATLSQLVHNRGWGHAAAFFVLPLDQYQVHQVERPEGVNDDELAAALKWKLKDFLDFSPADAVTDVFGFPEDAARGRGALINLVAARKSLVLELTGLATSAGIEPEQVDIAELALAGIAGKLDEEARGVALVHLRERYGQMVICRGGTLYLSRRLDIAHDELRDASSQENAVQTLALELQRSLDYFESQLGQVPPAAIRLVSGDASLPLASMLSGYVAGSVETLSCSSLGFKGDLDRRCLLAWAAMTRLLEAGS